MQILERDGLGRVAAVALALALAPVATIVGQSQGGRAAVFDLAGSGGCIDDEFGEASCAFAAGNGAASAGARDGLLRARVGQQGPVTSRALAFWEDRIEFGAGLVPTEIVFWLDSRWSLRGPGDIGGDGSATVQTYLGGDGGSMSDWVAWFQSLDETDRGLEPPSGLSSDGSFLDGPPSRYSFRSDAAVFRWYLEASAEAFHLGSGRYDVANETWIRGIQFVLDGRDVSRETEAVFASGTRYFLGDPTAVVVTPEPTSFVLLGLGLLLVAGARRRRGG